MKKLPERAPAVAWIATLVATCALAGCEQPSTELLQLPHQGEHLDGAPPETILASAACETPQPGSSPLRRLSNFEYENTLLSLGLDKERVRALVQLLPSEPVSLGFRNSATGLSVNSLLAQKYRQIAEELGNTFAASCDATSADCARQFISEIGLRMHRRPLTQQEETDYFSLYEKAVTGDSATSGLSWVVIAMLQSPHFLYRVEIPGPSVERVTGFEMASRLAYTFWQSGPDQELLDAARAGQLVTDEQILAQALRLLQDQRAFRIYEFFEQWLDLDELTVIERDPALYPDLNPQLATLLRAESRAFIQDLLADPESSLRDLLTARHTFANAALARHYGLEGPSGDTFERVDSVERSGILTQGMLAVQDAATHTSIVRRGLKIRTDFLCQLVPAPPDTVDLSLEGIGRDFTQAERLQLHSSTPGCVKCHSMMDPIGLAFDSIDAVGRPRSMDEHGNPLTTSGEIRGSMTADGPVASPHEVGEALAQSEDLEQCYMLQHFRFFFGRDAGQKDLCSQAQLTQTFRDSGQSLVGMLVGIAQSDAFLYKAGLGESPGLEVEP